MSTEQQTTDQQNTEQQSTFATFNLPPALNQSLVRMKYETPTPVQMQAIPPALEGRDVMGSAQTGTGKTAAFAIPMIARLLREGGCAIVLTPTRELASQIMTVVQQLLANNREIRTALLIGGEAMGRQFDQLKARPSIIIGTPGRINDHLRRNSSMLRGFDFAVLDEADRMLDMGFSVQIDTILDQLDAQRQTLMFSATFPDGIIKFAKTYLNDPVRIAVNPTKTSADNIKHELLHTTEITKYDDLVQQLDKRMGSIIVFVRTKHGADRLSGKLERSKHNVDVIHGGLRQRQRDRAILGFRSGKTRIMIATDVAARGLDVPQIQHVINYDLPQCADDYIHRIGRTARAGEGGEAVAFILPSEKGKWAAIDRVLNPGAKRERFERDERPRQGFKKPSYGNNKPWHKRKEHGGGYASKPRGNGDDFFGERADQIVQLREEQPKKRYDNGNSAPRDGQRRSEHRSDRPGNNRFEKRPYRGDGNKAEGQHIRDDRGHKTEGRPVRNDSRGNEGGPAPSGERTYEHKKRTERSFQHRGQQDRKSNGNGFQKDRNGNSNGFKKDHSAKPHSGKPSGFKKHRGERDGNSNRAA